MTNVSGWSSPDFPNYAMFRKPGHANLYTLSGPNSEDAVPYVRQDECHRRIGEAMNQVEKEMRGYDRYGFHATSFPAGYTEGHLQYELDRALRENRELRESVAQLNATLADRTETSDNNRRERVRLAEKCNKMAEMNHQLARENARLLNLYGLPSQCNHTDQINNLTAEMGSLRQHNNTLMDAQRNLLKEKDDLTSKLREYKGIVERISRECKGVADHISRELPR